VFSFFDVLALLLTYPKYPFGASLSITLDDFLEEPLETFFLIGSESHCHPHIYKHYIYSLSTLSLHSVQLFLIIVVILDQSFKKSIECNETNEFSATIIHNLVV